MFPILEISATALCGTTGEYYLKIFFLIFGGKNGLNIYLKFNKKSLIKFGTGPLQLFVRPASDLIKGVIVAPHQVFE